MQPRLIAPIVFCAAVVGLAAPAARARTAAPDSPAPVAVLAVVTAKVERAAHRVGRKVSHAARAARDKAAHAAHVAGKKIRHASHRAHVKAKAKVEALEARSRRALHRASRA